jgi:hypothetical protein
VALLDILRYAVDAVNNATGNPAIAQFRDVQVALVQESATLASVPCRLGTPGATYTLATILTVTPWVPVDFNPNPADPSWQGGGLQTMNDGTNTMTAVVIGPIAQAYDVGFQSGGYTDTQLVPPAVDPTSRFIYVLTGGPLPPLTQYGGVPFKPVWMWEPDPQTWKITAVRTEEFGGS